jgi:hypothetical protein
VSSIQTAFSGGVFVRKNPIVPLNPEKPYDFQIGHARDILVRSVFAISRTHLHPRSFIARFPPVRVKGSGENDGIIPGWWKS